MVGEFAVIGLGMFGRNVALNLVRAGHSVLAIDLSLAEVEAISGEIDSAVCADATDERALAELGLDRMSCAVVAIGAEATESSILATALLRQLGVPRIVARAVSPLHGRVLRAVGAHEVVNPEEQMGESLARRLAEPNVLRRLELGEGVDVAEVEVPEGFVGRTLIDLDLRRRYGISVVAIRRGGRIEAALGGDEQLASGDVLLLIGPPNAIVRVASLA